MTAGISIDALQNWALLSRVYNKWRNVTIYFEKIHFFVTIPKLGHKKLLDIISWPRQQALCKKLQKMVLNHKISVCLWLGVCICQDSEGTTKMRSLINCTLKKPFSTCRKPKKRCIQKIVYELSFCCKPYFSCNTRQTHYKEQEPEKQKIGCQKLQIATEINLTLNISWYSFQLVSGQ